LLGQYDEESYDRSVESARQLPATHFEFIDFGGGLGIPISPRKRLWIKSRFGRWFAMKSRKLDADDC